MRRRHFVKAAAVSAGATALAACGSEAVSGGAPAVQTGQRVSWQLVSSFPRSAEILFGPAQRMADRVAALTGDRFRIRVYPGGEIVPPLEVMGAVQRGSAQMAHTASYYFKGIDPAFVFDCTVPFGLTSRQQTAWLLHGGGMDLLRDLFADVDIVNLPGGNTGVQMGGWFRREVPTLADLRGLAMRIPGMGGEVMARLGVNPQSIAGGEIYPALERGVVDAAEWVGPYDDEKMGFGKIAKHYYAPGWWEPGPALTFYVNRPQWEALPQAYRDVLEVAAAESSLHMQAEYDARNPAALRRLVADGVQLHRFSDDILQAARRETTDLLETTASTDARFRRIYDDWKSFRAQSFDWFSITEESYARFAFPAR